MSARQTAAAAVITTVPIFARRVSLVPSAPGVWRAKSFVELCAGRLDQGVNIAHGGGEAR